MDPSREGGDGPVAEHYLAVFYGLGGALLGACVWSGAAAVFDEWSLLAAPGVGWLAAWSCSYGARRPDGFSRSASWVLATAGIVSGLAVYCAFSLAQASPYSDLRVDAVGGELLRLISAPPWFGSVAVLLAIAGVPRALAGREPSALDRQVPRATVIPLPGASLARVNLPEQSERERRAA